MSENIYNGLEIAVIGVSGQFPGSSNYSSYWQHLREGKELIRNLSDVELEASGVSSAELSDEAYVKMTGDFADKDKFDHSFFGYTDHEAATMDPQIRLFHQNCWKALEDAGYASSIDKKKIGLFAGASSSANWKFHVMANQDKSLLDPFYASQLSNSNFMSTLVSHKLNLRGPSLFVDTACSTSLVAVHLAVRSLLTRECTIALAGGICLTTNKKKGYLYRPDMVVSSDGHCRTFDAKSEGTIFSDGVGVVVLKRLTEALKDNDHIYAVIKSTAVNNDGNQKVGYTAPSVNGQLECIKMAHQIAGVDPATISYVEAHGTGTKLGDPIEVEALNIAFNRSPAKHCALGSVKSNIGHLDAAAGIAGLIKTVLSLKHQQIPASLHYQEANPSIDFEGGPFYVNTELADWKRTGDSPLRAGVSSFGVGGTNAHVILEEAPLVQQQGDELSRKYKILTISAKTESALLRYMTELSDFLIAGPEVSQADLCYTLQVGRKDFTYRKSLVYQDQEELVQLLNSGLARQSFVKSREGGRSAVFMFSGAGSQYVNMGKDLYAQEAVFRTEMDKGFSELKRLSGLDYKSILYPEEEQESRINEMLHTQPMIFLFGYALARLFMSWGMSPKYLIGHSVGEYVAACISGVFSFEDGLKLVVKRGLLMNRLAAGGMLSVMIAESSAKAFLTPELTLAAINGPSQVVFSGDVTSIDSLQEKLECLDISCVRLQASHAGHSVMMDSILAEYRKELESVQLESPKIPFISNLTGTFIKPEEAGSVDYWLRHIRETVQFSAGIKQLLQESEDLVFLEIGGGHSLSTIVRQHQTDQLKVVSLNSIRHFKENDNDEAQLAKCLGQLWSHGIEPDWSAYHTGARRKRISLPTYSFEPIAFPTEVNPLEQLSFLTTASRKKITEQNLQDCIYYPIWKQAIPPVITGNKIKPTYLFFSLDDEFASSLKSEFKKLDHEVIEVIPGSAFKYHHQRRIEIDPLIPLHFEQLMDILSGNQVKITHLIYAWAAKKNLPGLKLDLNDIGINLAYFSLVNIFKKLAFHNQLTGLSISILTDSLHRIAGDEKVPYAQSLLLGLMNVFPQEHEVICHNIDVDFRERPSEFAIDVANEINADREVSNRMVALRKGQRWIPDFSPHTGPLTESITSIKTGGIYLITGGLGNVGFVLAKFLIQKYQAKVVLTGRKRMQDQSAEERSFLRLKLLQEISKDVHYFDADVSDLPSFRKTIEKVEKNIGLISGVLHTAGTLDQQYFEFAEDITAENTFAIFRPKVLGIENIYKIFKNRNPDFVWITSSLASVLGGLKFSAYAAANLYVNFFVSSIIGKLPDWKCISLAELSFEEVPDANRPDHPALNPVQLTQLFEWSLSVKKQPLLLETLVDLYSRLDKAYAEKEQDFSTETRKEMEMLDREHFNHVYVPAGTETEIRILDIFKHFFFKENIGIRDNFFELGGDSLRAMALIKKIKTEFEINLPLKDFFTLQNIEELAAEIEERRWINKRSDKKNISII